MKISSTILNLNTRSIIFGAIILAIPLIMAPTLAGAADIRGIAQVSPGTATVGTRIDPNGPHFFFSSGSAVVHHVLLAPEHDTTWYGRPFEFTAFEPRFILIHPGTPLRYLVVAPLPQVTTKPGDNLLGTKKPVLPEVKGFPK